MNPDSGSRSAESLDAGLRARMQRIHLLCLDVDGVLTDGSLYFTESGRELKTFSSQDGHALKMLRSTGIATAIITGRTTRLVTRRARELSIDHLFQGARDKREAFAGLLARTALDAEQVAHVGDDIPDLAILQLAGLALAPANLNPTLRPWVDLVTEAPGGGGAVRELCELIMRVQGTWDAALEPWL